MIRLLGALVFSTSIGMSAFGQVQYEHVLTIENPRGEDSRGDRFGESVAVVGDTIVVGARNDNTGAIHTGAVFLFNQSGQHLLTVNNPRPDPNGRPSSGEFGDWFGELIVSVGDDKLLVGARGDNTGGADVGAAYLFDLQGNLLQTYDNPNPEPGSEFGKALASNGQHVLISAWDDSTAAPLAGAAYLFDLDGNLLQTLVSPYPRERGQFGRAATFVGDDRLLISDYSNDTLGVTAGAAFLFDVEGNLLQSYFNPTPWDQIDEAFGTAVAVAGDKILIGAAQDGSQVTSSGAAYLFDQDGNLLQTILDPEPNLQNWFGWSAGAVDDNRFIVGSIFNDDLGINSGKAFLYDTDGNQLFTFSSPTPHEGHHFGRAFAVLDQEILITEEAAGSGNKGFGAAFMFQPISIDGDANLDGVVDLADFNVLKQNFGSGDRFRHGDFDRDLDVDLNDFNIIKENLGNSQAVPEPTTILLLAVGLVSMSLFRQRRLRL